MFRIVAFWCAVAAVFLCAWAWIENTSAASFGGQYQSTYEPRAELFFWLLCLSLLALLMLAWKWIRLGLIVWRASGKGRRTVPVPTAQPIENLVPLTAYYVDETGYWGRLRWVSGIYFGLAVGIVMSLVDLIFPSSNSRYSPPATAAISLAISLLIAAPLSGVTFPALVRKKMRQITDGIYAGEPWIIDPPPANQWVYYQVPCTWVNGRVGVGGVLYLGRGGFYFQPHKKNKKGGASLEMSPIDSLRISRVGPPPLNGIQRLLIPHPQEQIEVTWSGGTAGFLMPSPADTFVKLEQCLKTFQHIPR